MIKQVLPESEREFLAVLKGDELKGRVKSLHKAGWTLQAISQAFTPPKQRSTLHSWTQSKARPVLSPPLPLVSSSSSSSKSTLPTAEKSASTSDQNSDLNSDRSQTRSYRMYDTEAPVLSKSVHNRIAKIAPIARRYRSKANPNGAYKEANDELTSIVKEQYARGVSIRELCLAAGVTYRAMARRLGR